VGLHLPVRFVALLTVISSCLYVSEVAQPAEFGDVEVSAYALGGWPRDEDIFNQGTTVPSSVQQGFGAGLRAGLFPAALHRAVGLEIDSNIHGGALSFPNIVNGRNNGTGRSDLLLINTMFNLIMRYPGERVRPYVGFGLGWSHGALLNPNIAGRDDKDFDSARSFTHQFLGGAQVHLPKIRLFGMERPYSVFLFGEYRYLSSNYHWEGIALDFRTHYGLLGAGLRF